MCIIVQLEIVTKHNVCLVYVTICTSVQPLYNSHPWDIIKVAGEVKYIVNCTLVILKLAVIGG